jgi:hypothetical protein
MDTEDYNEEDDLFMKPECVPTSVMNVLETYDYDADNHFDENDRILKKLEPLGYTFNYGLCGEPYNLHKI